jgi:UDP-N-acetylmuramoyl-L-alanyl-D-glutamate--2,6-diaminopimelate ligase
MTPWPWRRRWAFVQGPARRPLHDFPRPVRRCTLLSQMRGREPPRWASELFSVGVTGTNGKTSCSLWIAAALAKQQAPVATITSLGAFLDGKPYPVARSYSGLIAAMREAHLHGGRYSVVEFASWSLAQGYAEAWPCRVGVFTNLTHEHLDVHGSLENYLASKAQLFASLPADGAAVVNAADPASHVLIAALRRGVRCVTYGVRGTATGLEPQFELAEMRVETGATHLHVRVNTGTLTDHVQFSIRATGQVFAENALAALAAAWVAGVPLPVAAQAIAETPVPPGRFEVVQHEPLAVLDYAHTPDALARTLETCRQISRGRVHLVFGAGGGKDRSKRPLLGRVAGAADAVYLTSDNPRTESAWKIMMEVAEGLTAHPHVTLEPDRRVAIEQAIRAAGATDVVLVAGRGPETHQAVGSEWIALSDAEVMRSSLARRARQSTQTP